MILSRLRPQRSLFFIGNEDGTFESPITTNVKMSTGLGSLQLADVNGDGNCDLILNTGAGVVMILLGTVTELFNRHYSQLELTPLTIP